MNCNIIFFGIVIAFFFYAAGHKTLAFIIGLLAVIVGGLARTKTAKAAASSNVLEPIVVESVWGETIKPMPKTMTIVYETKEAKPKSAWSKPLGKGLVGTLGKKIGEFLEEE